MMAKKKKIKKSKKKDIKLIDVGKFQITQPEFATRRDIGLTG